MSFLSFMRLTSRMAAIGAVVAALGLAGCTQLFDRHVGSNRDSTPGSPDRPRSRTRGRHRQDGGSRFARASARVCRRYCVGLDITIRGPEERSLRKSIDTYTVLGPWLVTTDELSDPSRLALELSVNCEPRQKANTRDLIIDVPGLIAFATSFYTLMPGDVLLTGTPEGVGPIKGATSYDRQSPASVK